MGKLRERMWRISVEQQVAQAALAGRSVGYSRGVLETLQATVLSIHLARFGPPRAKLIRQIHRTLDVDQLRFYVIVAATKSKEDLAMELAK